MYLVRSLSSLSKSLFQFFIPRHKLISRYLWPNGSYYCSSAAAQDLLFRQLLDYRSYTYSYILGDIQSKEAIIIDPVYELVGRDSLILNELKLKLKYAVNTHVHADHVTGSGLLKQRLGCQSIISSNSKAKADIHVNHGDQIRFGKFTLEVRSTPGHTNGCLTFVLHEKIMAFTGDALLIKGCGRTDFQEGNAGVLYDSIYDQILSLPGNVLLYPAHDYTGQTVTTVNEEKLFNPRISKSKSEFIQIMNNLHLPYPKQIDRALPVNLMCGVFDYSK